MLRAYKPSLAELWFKAEMLADPKTMSYNHAYGGTIAFPEKARPGWYEDWIEADPKDRFYAYLQREDGTFVGEIAYHHDDDGVCLADVLIHERYRQQGYGREGLELLCQIATENGITEIYDDMAIDNPAYGMFRKAGFEEIRRDAEVILLKKKIRP